jgi:hypothetical protein
MGVVESRRCWQWRVLGVVVGQLLQYQRRHGHVNVPATGSCPSLCGNWTVAQLRAMHRSTSQTAQLRAIG